MLGGADVVVSCCLSRSMIEVARAGFVVAREWIRAEMLGGVVVV